VVDFLFEQCPVDGDIRSGACQHTRRDESWSVLADWHADHREVTLVQYCTSESQLSELKETIKHTAINIMIIVMIIMSVLIVVTWRCYYFNDDDDGDDSYIDEL